MNREEFTMQIVHPRCARIFKVLADKSQQYSSGTDKLHNFKKVAAFRGISSAEALMGMVSKHIAALDDFVQQCGKEGDYSRVSAEQWDEKIGDIINYMILLEGIIREKSVKGEGIRGKGKEPPRPSGTPPLQVESSRVEPSGTPPLQGESSRVEPSGCACWQGESMGEAYQAVIEKSRRAGEERFDMYRKMINTIFRI